ncbi:pseudouridine-5'-phosphate glycosidase-like isoform X1 [Lycium ferocissimum]|uniref:pseudouridine-5'-phosphate glycosidase-like isoform X1 n=2 Tax=Lycium ferocissimum TaxID=112874 RepID=UPI002815164D|nr:pseudouridine-5'-phosphate glycosidase-like isoform X1 [Lycium ferocissimum]
MASAPNSRLAIISRHFTSATSASKHGPNGQNLGWIKISPEVSIALKHGSPIVALESTIISHRMPYPQNFETAKELEVIVRENGAIPATIAILDGVPRIGVYLRLRFIVFFSLFSFLGLTTEELENLARLGSQARKTASRDIALVMAGRENGATTVSATMYLASMVGIPIFVTGGIGGVHRHGENNANIRLERKSGILIAVPIPNEHSASGSLIESAIQQALQEAREKKIIGNAETPFLLARVNELTGGASLSSNIALVKNNASVGAKIAFSLAQLQKHSDKSDMC